MLKTESQNSLETEGDGKDELCQDEITDRLEGMYTRIEAII